MSARQTVVRTSQGSNNHGQVRTDLPEWGGRFSSLGEFVITAACAEAQGCPVLIVAVSVSVSEALDM